MEKALKNFDAKINFLSYVLISVLIVLIIVLVLVVLTINKLNTHIEESQEEWRKSWAVYEKDSAKIDEIVKETEDVFKDIESTSPLLEYCEEALKDFAEKQPELLNAIECASDSCLTGRTFHYEYSKADEWYEDIKKQLER